MGTAMFPLVLRVPIKKPPLIFTLGLTWSDTFHLRKTVTKIFDY
jgi:hypothetical protein